MQRYFSDQNIFYDCVLADPDHPYDYHDADVVVAGTVMPDIGRPKSLGWGYFAAIITGGLYWVLGGPLHSQDCTVTYDFPAYYADFNKTNVYHFTDKRHCAYGLYGVPIPMARKPDLYEAGWNQLLYDVCRDLRAQRAAY